VRRRRRAASVCGALTGAAVVALAAGGSMAAPGTGAATPIVIPLASGVTTPAMASVALPMGDLGHLENTFWELFLQPSAGTAWTLHTPPGVADNGGVAVAVSPAGPVTVGFLPSFLLRFSPLARSTDGGTSWSSGLLPAPLADTPDALAEGPTGAFAVVGTGTAQRVLAGNGLSGWSSVTTIRSLARTATGCTVRRITAVAPATSGAGPVLGVQCAQPGRIGVLSRSPGTAGGGATAATAWSSIGPRLAGGGSSASRASGAVSVLRLETSAAGLSGLAGARNGGAVTLVAFWQGAGQGAWSQSPGLPVPRGWSVRATATGGGSGPGEAVLLGSGTRRTIATVAGPGATWVALPAPPAGTEALAVRGAATDAFAASGTHLSVWSVTAGSSSWSRAQTVNVPVPYGSSS